MKRIAWNFIRRSTLAAVTEELPLAIEANGVLWAVLAPIEDVVVVGDLHPVMQQQIRSLEALARQGKPLEKLWAQIDEPLEKPAAKGDLPGEKVSDVVGGPLAKKIIAEG